MLKVMDGAAGLGASQRVTEDRTGNGAAPAAPQTNGVKGLGSSHRELRPFNFYASAQPANLRSQEQRQGQPDEASGSEFSAPQEEDSSSDFNVAQQSDDSDYSGSRKRKRRPQISKAAAKWEAKQAPRVDTDMRRKLRSNMPIAEEQSGVVETDDSRAPTANGSENAGMQKDNVSETEDDSSLTKEDVDDPSAIPARVVSDEQLEEQRSQLKTNWEFIAVLDFLAAFQPYLGMSKLRFSAEELESALILNDGTSGLLVELHLALIKGISVRSGVHSGNWTGSLAEKLRSYWRLGPLKGLPPFTSHRKFEAPTYALLPLENRVTALRILCELRLEKDDLHNVVETALHPPKKTKAEKKAIEKAKQNGVKLPPEEPLPSMDTMRREPTAKDSSGLLYWYLDYDTTSGTRLYRELPSSMWKSKKKEAQGPDWELIANSAESLTEVGEKLRRSKKRADQHLADLILEDFVPELLERREADLRKQRAAARLQAKLQSIIPDGTRSRRVRKVVDYSYDAFDATIKAALRDDDSEPARVTRSAALSEPRLNPEEELLLGRRRGRSARGASPAGELPPFKRVRRQGDPASNPPSTVPSRGASQELTPEAEDLTEQGSTLEASAGGGQEIDPASRASRPEIRAEQYHETQAGGLQYPLPADASTASAPTDAYSRVDAFLQHRQGSSVNNLSHMAGYGYGQYQGGYHPDYQLEQDNENHPQVDQQLWASDHGTAQAIESNQRHNNDSENHHAAHQDQIWKLQL